MGFASPWLSAAKASMNDKQTADSITPVSSPIDLLVGGLAGAGMSGLVGAEAAPVASEASPWMASPAEGTTIEQSLAQRDPIMLHRYLNHPERLSSDDWDWIDHQKAFYKPPKK